MVTKSVLIRLNQAMGAVSFSHSEKSATVLGIDMGLVILRAAGLFLLLT
jgi:hypothetical protein